MIRKIIFIIGLLLLALFLKKINLDDVRKIQLLSPQFIIFIVSINGLALVLKTWRWHFLLSQFDIRLPRLSIFLAVSSGFYLGLVSPGTTGEFARIFRVPIQKQFGLATIFLEKLTDILVLFYLSLVGLFLLIFPKIDVISSVSIPLIFIGIMVFIAMKARPIQSRIAKVIINKFGLDKTQFENIVLTLQKTRIVLICILVSLLLWIIPGAQYYLICRSISIDITLQTLIISFYGPYLLGVMSMIPLGFGIFDLGASQMLYRTLSGGRDLANISVVLLRLLSTLPLVLFGFFCFLFTALKKKSTESV